MYKKWTDKITEEHSNFLHKLIRDVFKENYKELIKSYSIAEVLFNAKLFDILNQNHIKSFYQVNLGNITDEMKDDLKNFSLLIYQTQLKLPLDKLVATEKQSKLLQSWIKGDLKNIEKRLNAINEYGLNKTNPYHIFSLFYWDVNSGTLKRDGIHETVIKKMCSKNLEYVDTDEVNTLVKKDEAKYLTKFAKEMNKNDFNIIAEISQEWKEITGENIRENNVFIAEMYNVVKSSFKRLKDEKALKEYSVKLLRFIVNNPSFLELSTLLKENLNSKPVYYQNTFNLENIHNVEKLNILLRKNNEDVFYDMSHPNNDKNDKFEINPAEDYVKYSFVYHYMDIIKSIYALNGTTISSKSILYKLEDLESSSQEDDSPMLITLTEKHDQEFEISFRTKEYSPINLKKVMNTFFKSLMANTGMDFNEFISLLEQEKMKDMNLGSYKEKSEVVSLPARVKKF